MNTCNSNKYTDVKAAKPASDGENDRENTVRVMGTLPVIISLTPSPASGALPETDTL